MKPIVRMVLSTSLVLSSSLIASAAGSAAVFKDPGLEANVRNFNHGADPSKPLTQDELNHVYLVSASNKPIHDLAGLENCPNLNTIYLTGSQVSDLTPLSKLTNLEQLTISGAKIQDLKPLAGLTHLRYLDLSQNQISDLTPLANWKSLQTLSIKQNRVTDLTPLTSLTAWHGLYLDQNQVSDLTPLVTMVQPGRQPIKGLQPFWVVSVRGNPLSEQARSRELPELRKYAFDVIVDR